MLLRTNTDRLFVHQQVIDLRTQLSHFVELQNFLSEKTGSVAAKQFFAEAVYLLSIGSNDYMGGYLANPAMQQMYPPEQYVAMVVGNFTEAVAVWQSGRIYLCLVAWTMCGYPRS